MTFAPSEQFDQHSGADAHSPESKAVAQERQQALLSQIGTLSANQQEVLRLKFHGELSYKEIAEVTGLTTSNVGFLLHTAISKLRQRVS